MADSSALLSTEIEFENDIKKDPNAVKYWWRYLAYKAKAPAKERNQLHERALSHVPGSYKLWFQYLVERAQQVADRPLDSPVWERVNDTFERALIFMSKMPRIWVEYIKFLVQQKRVTQTRRTVDRALQALPLTQHDKVWKLASEFMRQDYVPVETAHRMWRRYLQLEPNSVEDYVTHLKKHERWNDVINTLIKTLNNTNFVSMKGRTRHELWVELCTILSRQGDTLRLDDANLSVDKIIRSGIQKFPHEVGQLWCALANYNTYCRNFDKVRDLYEEGIKSVSTVKDFAQIFGAYAEFEESLLTVKMEKLESGEADDDAEDEQDPYTKALLKVTGTEFDQSEDVDYSVERLEHLMNRRAELLNSVMIRQNPHNVHEWHKRVDIFKNSPQMVVRTYTEAVKTVDVAQAKGKPHTLWVAFAKWYEENGDLRSARQVLDRAVAVPFKAVDDLASVWCFYAEMELRAKKYRRALDILKKATATNFTGQGSWKKVPGQPVQEKTWRSVKLWSFYADLNEALCTVRSTKNVYDRMTYLKVVTPQLLLHYANYMKEHGYWEEAFKVYQQGVQLFHWPLVHDIWVAYIAAFVSRFKGRKMERMRDMFEQCLKDVPKKHAKRFYLMYAHFEERYGLAKLCLDIYNRAASAVPEEEVLDIFERYIRVTKKFFGTIKTRDVYKRAVSAVPEKHVPDMCLEFAGMEEELGEIDRARELFKHAAQYVDPRKENAFWPAWNEFEQKRGNQDTFQVMLRCKRSVQAVFSSTFDMSDAVAQAREDRAKFEARRQAESEAAPGQAAPRPAASKGRIGPNPEEERMVFVPQAAQEAPADTAPQAGNTEAEGDAEMEAVIPDSIYAEFGKRGAETQEGSEAETKRQRTS